MRNLCCRGAKETGTLAWAIGEETSMFRCITIAAGGNAVADAEQVPGAAAIIPPPSKSALPMPAEPPPVELPMALGATVIELPMAVGAGADEAPTHVVPIMGAAPDVIGLTPGVASSVAPMGIPVCPTGAFGMPRGDVTPSAGRGETFMRVCA